MIGFVDVSCCRVCVWVYVSKNEKKLSEKMNECNEFPTWTKKEEDKRTWLQKKQKK